jgi:excisionase family DNA binding protein
MTLLKTAEVAKILRVSQPTARRIIADGEMRSIKVGRSIRVDLADLTTYLQGEDNKVDAIDTEEI